eukprot:m.224137 g.224137  ORF g.224137 m.224137 type:complete len:301 (-) comp11045_c0_seq1:8-910(-)
MNRKKFRWMSVAHVRTTHMSQAVERITAGIKKVRPSWSCARWPCAPPQASVSGNERTACKARRAELSMSPTGALQRIHHINEGAQWQSIVWIRPKSVSKLGSLQGSLLGEHAQVQQVLITPTREIEGGAGTRAEGLRRAPRGTQAKRGARLDLRRLAAAAGARATGLAVWLRRGRARHCARPRAARDDQRVAPLIAAAGLHGGCWPAPPGRGHGDKGRVLDFRIVLGLDKRDIPVAEVLPVKNRIQDDFRDACKQQGAGEGERIAHGGHAVDNDALASGFADLTGGCDPGRPMKRSHHCR